MTKYILAGGADRKNPDYGPKLTAEVYKTVEKPAKVLSCWFAEPRENWDSKFANWEVWFKQFFGNETVCELASSETFKTQSQKANVLYIHGGDDELLISTVKKIPNFKQLLSSFRVVIGSSAGAILLSNYSWCCDRRCVQKGIAAVPANVLVHYESSDYAVGDPRGPIDWQKTEAELQAAIGPKGKITRLREGEFAVFEK